MLTIQVLPYTLAICKLTHDSVIPAWVLHNNQFFSITKTEDELSIVCNEAHIPNDIQAEKEWRVFKVVGPLDFSLTGILASITQPLATNAISIFAISTYDTDYILVKKEYVDKAVAVLKKYAILRRGCSSL